MGDQFLLITYLSSCIGSGLLGELVGYDLVTLVTSTGLEHLFIYLFWYELYFLMASERFLDMQLKEYFLSVLTFICMAYGKAGFLVQGLQLLALAATHQLSSQKHQVISLQSLLMRNMGETHPEGT